jgi:lactoylglutathione lyase
MPTYKYDHVHLASPDPEATANWYVEKFGATVTGSSPAAGGGTMVMVSLNGSNIFIKPGPANKAPAEGAALEHFGIVTDDLDTAAADLKAKGVKFTQDVTNFRPGVRISFLLGPDNVLIELLERKPVK